jgi:hypothetical protein
MGANIKDRDDAGAGRLFERAIHLHNALEKITIGQLGGIRFVNSAEKHASDS